MKQGESLESIFQKYTNLAKMLSGTTNNDDLLYLYSRYKQATIGNCNTEKPKSLFDKKAQRKWESWSSLNQMTKNKAMEEYIIKVKELLS